MGTDENPAHDAILDILAEDSHRRLVNLEIQRKDTIEHARRTRFYAAMRFVRKSPFFEM